MTASIRKIIVQVDEIRMRDGPRTSSPPTRRALAMAVIANPFAGRYSENLDELIAIGEELGALLGERCVQALGIAPGQAQSYGKAAIVGEAGELEHAAAILHPKLGAPLRLAVEKGAALVPSSKEAGRPRHRDRRAARAQGRGFCAQPFRRDGGTCRGCAACQRDCGRCRRHRQRPATTARGRPAGPRNQGRGRAPLKPELLSSSLPIHDRRSFS